MRRGLTRATLVCFTGKHLSITRAPCVLEKYDFPRALYNSRKQYIITRVPRLLAEYFVIAFNLRKLLERVSKVTINDLDRVGQKYIAPLFDPLTSRCAVCCHPSKVGEIREGLGKYVVLNVKDMILVCVYVYMCVFRF